jgi:hypothetical protein
METKIWDCSFSREDVEVSIGRALTDGEWNIVVDELYNNDTLYNTLQAQVTKIVLAAIE